MMGFTYNSFFCIVLQVLWAFRQLYESIVTSSNPGDECPKASQGLATEKRHLIHLFTSAPHNGEEGRPVCYMHVCEVISPEEEKQLQCGCGAILKDGRRTAKLPPTNRMSRESFTKAWIDSFSLVV